MERTDKILANLGYCSRGQARDFLREHEITIDGEEILDGSRKADAHRLLIDGKALDHPDGIFIMMYKPLGYICSHDEGPRIYDLLPEQWMYRNPLPSSIGRLDKDATGLILITDITMLNHVLTSPKRRIDKVYQVEVDKPLDNCLVERFSSGIVLEGDPKPCLPAKLTVNDDLHAEIILHEGRYHQVKRMFGSCGYLVTRLHRSQFGPYSLGDLAEGSFVDLPIPDTRDFSKVV